MKCTPLAYLYPALSYIPIRTLQLPNITTGLCTYHQNICGGIDPLRPWRDAAAVHSRTFRNVLRLKSQEESSEGHFQCNPLQMDYKSPSS